MSTADTAKTDQCSICLDSPPYSECPGRQCQRLANALKAKEEAAAALEAITLERDTYMIASKMRPVPFADTDPGLVAQVRELQTALEERNAEIKVLRDSLQRRGKSVWPEIVELRTRAERAEKALEEAQRDRWVPLSERLPADQERVLTIPRRHTAIDIYTGVAVRAINDGCRSNGEPLMFTHWMPLPELPIDAAMKGDA